MSNARDNILNRLRANRPQTVPAPPAYEKPLGWDREHRIEAFSARLQAVRGEVHRIDRERWVDWLNREMPARGLSRGLVGSSAIGEQFAANADPQIALTHYERTIESWKDELFHKIDFLP